MIIISIDGGLGNQMFQFAFYLAMRECYPHSDVKIDLSMLRETTHNGYELEKVFGITALFATPKEVKLYSDYCPEEIKGYKLINIYNRIKRKIGFGKKGYYVQRDSTGYDETYFCLNQHQSYYLRGVWANTKYFNHIRKQIVQTFSFPPMEKLEKNLEEKMRAENTIGIHVRRGDYVKYGFRVLGKEYYYRAIEYIEKVITNPQYVIFSDDIEYAKDLLNDKIEAYYVMQNQGKRSYIDMQLMSMCDHNIIANSTFSFWAAYLNANASKIVIYPDLEVKGCSEPYHDENWIKMEVSP